VGPGRGAGPAACHSEDLSIALLLTLDRLSPLERAAFLLHYVFDLSFGEMASALERSKAARRQLAARARAHVLTARPRGATAAPEPSGGIDAKHAQLMSAFAAATLVSVDKGRSGASRHLLADPMSLRTRCSPSAAPGAGTRPRRAGEVFCRSVYPPSSEDVRLNKCLRSGTCRQFL